MKAIFLRKFSIHIALICCLFAFRAYSQKITIAAAADTRYVMEELSKEFQKANPSIQVDFIYGSSGNLYQQIVNSAPYDVFFSADLSFPEKLYQNGLTTTNPKLYGIGHLVLWSSKIDISKGIESFKSPDLKKIAIANPKVAPYGKRALECLQYYHIYTSIENNIVQGENVSQAAQFALSGNAEIGIIALSIALSPEMSTKGKYFLLDEKSYSKLEQAYVVIKRSDSNKNVMIFTKFIESESARKIFRKYGFKLPNEK